MQKNNLLGKRLRLPPDGFIVSCYLEPVMHGTEKQFIDSVLSVTEYITALRVEGIENIRYTRDRTSKIIIGLVKDMQPDSSYITSTVDNVKMVIDAGADIVAIDSRECNSKLYELYKTSTVPVMADVQHPAECKAAYDYGAEIISTTFKQKAFEMVKFIREHMPDVLINLEGGIVTAGEIKRGFEIGANYVTVGKMINHPPFIIKQLLNK